MMDDVAEFFKKEIRDLQKKTIQKVYQQKQLKERLEEFNDIRRQTRTSLMLQKRKIDIRNLSPFNTPDSEKVLRKSVVQVKQKPNQRLEMLKKWKIDKAKRLQEEKQKSKPVFKVCHIPINVGLPNLDTVNKEIKGKPIKVQDKLIVSKFAPRNHTFKPPANIKPINFNNASYSNVVKVDSKKVNVKVNKNVAPATKVASTIINKFNKVVKKSPNKSNKIPNKPIQVKIVSKVGNFEKVKKPESVQRKVPELKGKRDLRNNKLTSNIQNEINILKNVDKSKVPLRNRQKSKESLEVKKLDRKVDSQLNKDVGKCKVTKTKRNNERSKENLEINKLANKVGSKLLNKDVKSTAKEIKRKETSKENLEIKKLANKVESKLLNEDVPEYDLITSNILYSDDEISFRTPHKTPLKTPRKTTFKTPQKSPLKTPQNTRFNTHRKTPYRAPGKTPRKLPKMSTENETRDSSMEVGRVTPSEFESISKESINVPPLKTPRKTSLKTPGKTPRKSPKMSMENETGDSSMEVGRATLSAFESISKESINVPPLKTPRKTPIKTPRNTPLKTPGKTPRKSPIKTTKNRIVDSSIEVERMTPISSAFEESLNVPPLKTPRKTPRKTTSKEDIQMTQSVGTPANASFVVNDNRDKTPKNTSNNCMSSKSGKVERTPIVSGDLNSSVAYISPFVTISRGKESARKEYKIRQSTGGALPYSSDQEKSFLASSTSPKAGALYFTKKLDEEIVRIESLCDKWTDRKENDVPDDAKDLIDTAIGQSKLLISKKFKQFHDLIIQCRDCQYKEKPVTCVDLHGFWDMIYMQVEDIDKRFGNLEKLKDNNWSFANDNKQKTKTVKTRPARQTKIKAASKIKDMIKQARAQQQNTINNTNITDCVVTNERVNNKPSSQTLSILQTESVQTRASSSPGLTMMKITQAIKKGDGVTPSSILKKNGVKSERRMTKCVLFKDLEEAKEKTVLMAKELNKENFDCVNVSFSSRPRRSKRLSNLL